MGGAAFMGGAASVQGAAAVAGATRGRLSCCTDAATAATRRAAAKSTEAGSSGSGAGRGRAAGGRPASLGARAGARAIAPAQRARAPGVAAKRQGRLRIDAVPTRVALSLRTAARPGPRRDPARRRDERQHAATQGNAGTPEQPQRPAKHERGQPMKDSCRRPRPNAGELGAERQLLITASGSSFMSSPARGATRARCGAKSSSTATSPSRSLPSRMCRTSSATSWSQPDWPSSS
ncbi:MAG: hypothetical protein K0R38_3016 [Polyangiaceae bacterium]|nr:hypothetical protein [Polyangiaceae bacterium]